MPFVNLGPRLKIHYLDINRDGRRVVLLLHGLGATGESWGLQLPELIDAGYHILAPDARGFGRSSYPGGGTSIKEMAGDMLGLLHSLDAPYAHVVGISMGGTLALQLALDHPAIVEKLVLVNTFANLRPKRLGVWVYFFIRFIVVHTIGLPTQARIAAGRIFPHSEQEHLRRTFYNQVMQSDPSGYRATMRALSRFNVQKRLKEIRAPTLVISGEADSTVPLKNQKALASGIYNANHTIISNAGHAVIVDMPMQFNQILINFLNQ